ncbi:hypothetical protein CANINC_001581 [Pichia inconspicua]|uniref:Uncharacterized protein n=1 Tax=Pichia inconspicua TaxID=52247 RepID=A0A4T0X4I8_9ASCO|nr:hypothetical protein CANINC_001581 [[Candida] inconspicua]
MSEGEKNIGKPPGEVVGGIGLGIEPPPSEEIDDLQSPPNSPGMVLAGIHSNTNEKIDFFVLDATVNEAYPGSTGLPSQDEFTKSDSMFSTPLELKKQKRLSQLPENKEEVDLKLFSSSDSYFSRARKSSEHNFKRQSMKTRRASDVSDRSDGARSINSIGLSDIGSSGSYYSESDTELTASPSAKYVKRRNLKMRDTDDVSSDFSSFSDVHEDDGIVYRSANSKADASGFPTGLRNRSSSRIKSDKDDFKDKGKDGSATAQVFKNLLILEESMRQQYAQQQCLRHKYTLILLVWILIFIISTYFTSFNSIYATTSRTVIESTQVSVYQTSTSTCILETTINNNSFCADFKPTESTTFGIDKGNKLECSAENEIIESGYVFVNIVIRIISIITGMTLLLFFVTGEYTRTISRPRKFLNAANKGIRQLNVKLVKVKLTWKESIMQYITQFNIWKKRGVEHIRKNGVDHIKLVLNPRVFSTATREQWELYRNQFWSLEEIRRLGQENSKSK